MEDKIQRATENILCRIGTTVNPDEALKFTQAALNLAHVAQVEMVIKQALIKDVKPRTKPTGS